MYPSINTIMGIAVGDALGVPVEFYSRKDLYHHPVTGMRGYGSHYQPKGTWSDDSSMTLATLDALTNGLDYTMIADHFLKWYHEAAYTAHDHVFDIGITTVQSLSHYQMYGDPLTAGGAHERANGNGSLMRIAPVALYLLKHGHYLTDDDLEGYEMIHNVSAITHRHPRSMVACGIYCRLLIDLIRYKDQSSKEAIVTQAIDDALYIYDTYDFPEAIKAEVKTYAYLADQCTFTSQDVDKIHSSGYVVHSLEAAIYCFMNTDNYQDCLLDAVNLGEDTDTTGAIAGGLAGTYYGLDGIPEEWVDVIAKKEWIMQLCEQFDASLK